MGIVVGVYEGCARRRRHIHQNPQSPAQLSFEPDDSKSDNGDLIYPKVCSNELGLWRTFVLLSFF